MPTCPRGHTSTAADYCDVCGRPMSVPAPSVPAAAPAASPAPSDPVQACPQCGTPRTGRFCEVDGYDFMTATLHETPTAVRHPFAGTPGAPPVSGPAVSGPPVAAGPPAVSMLKVESPAPPVAASPVAASPGAAPPGAASPVAVPPLAASPVAEARQPFAPEPPPTAQPAAAQVVVTADRAYFEIVRAAGGPDAGIIEFPDYCPDRRFPLRGSQLLIGRRSRSRGISPEIDLTGPPEDPGVSHAHALLLPHTDGGWAVVDLGSANGTYVNDPFKPVPIRVPVPVRAGDRIYAGAWTVLLIT